MKQNINRKIYSALLMCVVLLAGCTKAPIVDNIVPGDGKAIEATFTLAPDFVQEIEVRSVDGANEGIIKDVWIVQLNAAGTAQLQAPQYITTVTTAGVNDYKVIASIKAEPSLIYFIANSHKNDAYTTAMTTTELVEAVIMEVANEADLASADGIPMSGVWTGTPDLSSSFCSTVSLSRAVAKINFNLTASLPGRDVFKLQSITVKQVPNALNYFRDQTTVTPYPITPTVMDYSPTVYDNLVVGATIQTLWWYLPENVRGTGTATKQGDKASKFPTDQAAYCTYIEIFGMYESEDETYSTSYKIYLGANNTSDYNINRNTVYNVNTTIKGIDMADTRINTTLIQKRIIIGMFGGWDETKREYTKPLEIESVEAENDPELRWVKDQIGSTISGATQKEYGLMNIDKLLGNPRDDANKLLYPAAWHCFKKNDKNDNDKIDEDETEEWYLPSECQLMAIWIVYEAVPSKFLLNGGLYWSSTENAKYKCWAVTLNDGLTSNADYKYFTSRVRCVRDITPPGILTI